MFHAALTCLKATRRNPIHTMNKMKYLLVAVFALSSVSCCWHHPHHHAVYGGGYGYSHAYAPAPYYGGHSMAHHRHHR